MTEPLPPDHSAPLLSAGQLLRQAREGAGLHVVALAAMLKVPVRKLEALEAERFDELPDKTFVRTLALSVCRQLKVDPTPILALLPQSEQVRLGEVPSLNTPFRSAGGIPMPKQATGAAVPRSVLFALGVLLLSAVVWFTVPSREGGGVLLSESAGGAEQVVAPATEAGAAPAQVAAAGTEPSVTTAPAEPGDGVPAGSGVGAMPAVPAAMGLPATATSAKSATDGVLSIRAMEVSWVEVVGPSGGLLLQRDLSAGETVGFSSDGPYKVVVGRADATQVHVRGKVLDISSYARNNVARFEVR